MSEKGILKNDNTTLEMRDSDAIFRKCISNIWIISEIYYGIISAELQEEAQKEHIDNNSTEIEAEEKSADEHLRFFYCLK